VAPDGTPETAVVFDPCKNELFHAVRGAGAYVNDRRIHVSRRSALDEALFVTGFPYNRREHAPFYLKYFEAFMLRCRDVRRLGSAALDLSYVAAGRFDGFWEVRLNPWDMAAGAVIAREAGGRLTDFSGQDLSIYGQELVASNGQIHEAMLAVLNQETP